MEGLVRRAVEPWARELLTVTPILTVEGARQTGKSTLAQMLTDGTQAKIVSLDEPDVLMFARNDPRGFVDQAADQTLVIDEVQRVPSLTLSIKASVDKDRRPGRFILTGSSDLARMRGEKDSLAGRSMTINLLPFTQAELRGTTDRGTFVDRLLAAETPNAVTTAHEPLTHQVLIDLIIHGGLPAAQNLTSRLRSSWYRSYVEKLTRVDALDGGEKLNPERLLTSLRLIAANQSGEIVKARFGQEAAIPAPSITNYLDALTRLYLVQELRPWTPNLTSRETGRRKASVVDPGLAAWLCGATKESLSSLPHGLQLLGQLTEGLVTTELHAQVEWGENHYRLYHYRDRNGREIDFILELDDGRIMGIEVKASRTLKGSHFNSLRFLRDRLKDRMIKAVVLAPIDMPVNFGERLWGLPMSALWT
jgi:hypothetical protein